MESQRSGSPFCHIIPRAPDLVMSKLFYESIFNWSARENVPGPRYWFFESGNVGGACGSNHKPVERSIVLVIKVDDMPATLQSISKQGGVLTPGRSRIGEVAARYDAYFLDPNGNEMELHSDE